MAKVKKPASPDWASGRTITGAVRDYWPGDSAVWKFPNDRGHKREISVEINTWRGLSAGATHWYGEVQVERNAFWVAKETAWASGGHDACKPQHFKCSVFTRADAVRFVIAVVEALYADEAHYKYSFGHRDDLTLSRLKALVGMTEVEYTAHVNRELDGD